MTEDTDNDDVPDTVRCRAWAKNASLTALRLAPDVLSYRLQGVGLIDADGPEAGLLAAAQPPAERPAGGDRAHLRRETDLFLQPGTEPDTADYIAIAADIWAGTTSAGVPGTWGRQQGTALLREHLEMRAGLGRDGGSRSLGAAGEESLLLGDL